MTTGAIVRWPGMTGKPGRIEASAIHILDVMPTILEAVGRFPDLAESAGESFLTLIKDSPWQRKQPMFFQYMDNRAIRTVGWTLAEVDDAGWELFNTTADPLETTNLAATHPEVVAELDAKWLAWWKDQSGNTNYRPVSTKSGPNYKSQGDHGSGKPYMPNAMPAKLANRYPLVSKP